MVDADDDDVASPCVSVCKMAAIASSPDALCAGCLRTIEEIAGWGSASATQKRLIWGEIAKRRLRLKGHTRA
jgi:predicted Fe-S protein YdhL (DUF1289 family)